MTLVVDIGNSTIVLGAYNGRTVRARFRVQSVRGRLADEYMLLFAGLLRSAHIDPLATERVIIGSVSPTLTQPVASAFQHITGCAPLIVTMGLKLNVRVHPEAVHEIGIDLIADAAAAFERCKQAAIILDFGTALTFTAVDDTGMIQGVAIAPGLRTAMRSLAENTALLPDVPLTPAESYLGHNTIQALQAGVGLGYCGLVEAVVQGMQRELDPAAKTPTVLATGGESALLAARLPIIDAVDPLLTLDGLRLIGELNL